MLELTGVADGLALPEDVVTQSLAILAMRRAGKSNSAVVLAERMYEAALPFTVIDPKGDWWGLRSSKDGTGPGLPIPVLGGLHGDMPLTPESGRLIAELIVEQNLTCILDVSDFPSDAARTRFLTDFAKHLFALHRKNPHPRHLFLEEADDYIPQQVTGEMAKCVGAWSKIVKQGGAFGLGMTLISQRSAVINKNVLTQVETLIALRTTSPQDRAAVKAWVDHHATGRELVDSLPGLADGEAWVCSPNWLARHGQPALQRVQFHQRATFDSGATPTMASAARPPATLADINLTAIASQMQALAEQANAEDPATLRKRIRDLERELTAARKGQTGPAEASALRAKVAALSDELARERAKPPQVIEVPVLTTEDRTAVATLVSTLRGHAGTLEAALTRATPPAAAPAPARAAAVKPAKPTPAAAAAAAPPEPTEQGTSRPRPLKAGARTMLEQLASHHPLKMTRHQLAALSGIKGSGSTFSSYFSALRVNGYVRQDDMFVVITPEGLTAAGATADAPPMTPDEIRARWRSVLKAGARAMLDLLIEQYPGPMTRAELGERAGINPAGSTLSSYLSTLRSNNLITEDSSGVRAAGIFFLPEAREADQAE